MFNMPSKQLEEIRKKHPAGTAVELVSMTDVHAPAAGTRGTVLYVDDIGQIHVAWATGLHLALVPGVDEWTIVESI